MPSRRTTAADNDQCPFAGSLQQQLMLRRGMVRFTAAAIASLGAWSLAAVFAEMRLISTAVVQVPEAALFDPSFFNSDSDDDRHFNINYVLRIPSSSYENNEEPGAAEEYLMTEFPKLGVLENDFTIELWYRTVGRQPLRNTTNAKATILSNLRAVNDAKKYGRDFGIYVDIATGQVVVEFHGYNPESRSFVEGTLWSSSSSHQQQRIDDGKWHSIKTIRNGLDGSSGTLTLEVDGMNVSSHAMPVHHDYSSQEQRIVVGGGTQGNHQISCEVDNLRIWSKAVMTSSDHHQHQHEDDPHLVMYLSFDDPSDGIMIHDCAPNGNGAIRVGERLRRKSAFVVPDVKLPSLLRSLPVRSNCRSWPSRDGGDGTGISMTPTMTLITYLGVDCEHKGVWFQPHSIYELNAYTGALWLDANRLGVPLIIVTECLPQEFANLYTTDFVTFRDVNLEFQTPRECHHNNGGAAYMKRFLAFGQMLERGAFGINETGYLVSLDLRDSRFHKRPEWGYKSSAVAPQTTEKKPTGEDQEPRLWLQSIRQSGSNAVCGGFQAGNVPGMKLLFQELTKTIRHYKCETTQKDDQGMLNEIHSSGKLSGASITIDGNIINSQHTRLFDQRTAFTHGNWWMSKTHINDAYARKAYPWNVPYSPSNTTAFG